MIGAHQILVRWRKQREWDGWECGLYQGEKKYIQGFGRKSGGMLPLGRLRRSWENNISVGV